MWSKNTTRSPYIARCQSKNYVEGKRTLVSMFFVKYWPSSWLRPCSLCEKSWSWICNDSLILHSNLLSQENQDPSISHLQQSFGVVKYVTILLVLFHPHPSFHNYRYIYSMSTMWSCFLKSFLVLDEVKKPKGKLLWHLVILVQEVVGCCWIFFFLQTVLYCPGVHHFLCSICTWWCHLELDLGQYLQLIITLCFNYLMLSETSWTKIWPKTNSVR